ncbi:hypothetical protein KP509_17G057900 [Ceratopteris richardii]|uniref:Uncharacterized protein n=1 Tax=Ceratopteris richardii TaxID=49495 RepID=A0A8T2SYK2_CERRI|nr:hypothetical protein KP509_17G057900 [Ceratopteris richardii]
MVKSGMFLKANRLRDEVREIWTREGQTEKLSEAEEKGELKRSGCKFVTNGSCGLLPILRFSSIVM